MTTLQQVATMLVFPGGLYLMLNGLAYEWIDRKVVARLQNRIGPRWFQPLADLLKLLTKEEIVPEGANPVLFHWLPIVALAGPLTAALYIPLVGLAPNHQFAGDLIVVLYLLSLLTLCTALAGANTEDRFSLLGAVRALTQLFAYEAPFVMAMLAPAALAGSWQIGEIAQHAAERWLILTLPIAFVIALVGLVAKLELPPFDAPEAETEIVAGALTEYSGRGLALFRLSRMVELVVGLTLIAPFYLGGLASPLDYFAKTLVLVFVLACVQALVARLRMDQMVGIWWRYGSLLVLVQWLVYSVVQWP